MAGNTQTAFLNDNVTIICKIPGSPLLDIKIIGITWFRKSPKSGMEVKLFECFGKHRTVFRPGASVSPVRLKTGDASLQLPDVQLWETGEYRCEVVVTPQKAKGRVWLHVLAHPTSALFPEKPVVKGNEDNHTVGKSSGFYPEAINITWEKWTLMVPHYLEISEGIIDHIIKNEDGIFNITSSSKLKPSL
ncbi:B7 like protein 6 [Tupaia chinensis]|uniref:B7 like protein 6 n=1 Tax=Tupaia chinensis TaxID=246437 RepID=L9L6Z4_TUPCH|nr:B7 like protein 6 [Tupaia chinensis]